MRNKLVTLYYIIALRITTLNCRKNKFFFFMNERHFLYITGFHVYEFIFWQNNASYLRIFFFLMYMAFKFLEIPFFYSL